MDENDTQTPRAIDGETVDAATVETAPAEAPKLVTIDQFAAIDLRVALIEQAEAVPKSKKLIKLQVYLGEKYGRRQVLAGIAQWKTPESLIGKKFVMVANLEPATLMGHQSQGMILAADSEDHSRVEPIEAPEGFEPGSQIR